MNIKTIAGISGLSVYTLRYYEKIGLLKNIKRDSSGYRDYTENDITWLEFIDRLKKTGMPVKDMLIFADLRYRGDNTIELRKEMLEKHKLRIEKNIEQMQHYMKKINEKIEIYKNFKK